jgi:hypothetical protein
MTINTLIRNHFASPKKILFYTHIPRAFKSTLIGYLYEICQQYSTILLSEKLDTETQHILQNKSLFPKLEKIIQVRGFTDFKIKPFDKNKQLYVTAKKVIQEYKPEVVISPYCMHAPFGWYLMRQAGKKGIFRIYVQPSNIGRRSANILWNNLAAAELRFPHWMPRKVRILLARMRRHLKNIFFLIILPLSIGQKPLWREVHWNKNSNIHKQAVWTAWSNRERDIFNEEGVAFNNIHLLPHPMEEESIKDFFAKAYINKYKKLQSKKSITLLLPVFFGFNRNNLKPISFKNRLKQWCEIVQLVHKIRQDCLLYIKPHPYLAEPNNINYYFQIKQKLESIASCVLVTNPKESVEKYIKISDIIIGLPTSNSTALVSATVQAPKKLIISIDNHNDLLGDTFKDQSKIKYITNLEDLKITLKTI